MKNTILPPPKKNQFNYRPIKRFFGILGLITILSCESQLTNDDELQSKILKDDDFVSMMADLFVAHEENPDLFKSGESSQNYLSNFRSYFKILDKRYDNFHYNAQQALEKRGGPSYELFTDLLVKKILSKSSTLARKKWDGSSVCGRDCGNFTNTTTACIAGCLYSGAYCNSNGGSNCGAMVDSCKGSCCRSFCPEI